MNVTFGHEIAENGRGLIVEQGVVGQNDGGAPVWLSVLTIICTKFSCLLVVRTA